MKRLISSLTVLGLAAAMAAAQQPPAPPGDVAPPAPPQAPGRARPPKPPRPPKAPQPVRAIAAISGGYLGIGVAEIDNDRAKALKLSETRGVEVTTVSDNSPAAKAGIKDGDVVLEYNGQRVEGTQQFERLVRETPPGREVKLVVSRSGRNQTLTATLGNRKDAGLLFAPGVHVDLRDFQRDMHGFEQGMRDWQRQFRMQDMPNALMAWRSGYLGIETESLNQQLAEFFGVKDGVLVRSVNKDSAAEKAGIKAGDVITKIDGVAVSSARDITARLRSRSSQQKTFPVTIVRNRQEMTVSVTIDQTSPRAWIEGEIALRIPMPQIEIPMPRFDLIRF